MTIPSLQLKILKKADSDKKIRIKFVGIKKNNYLCTRKTEENAPVAQLVEHLTLNQGVQGSNPCGCTKQSGRLRLTIFLSTNRPYYDAITASSNLGQSGSENKCLNVKKSKNDL